MTVFDDGPTGEMIGYCRVSTQEQDVGLQKSALIRAGVKPENILVEKISGAARRLPVRERAIKMSCRKGWTLVVWKLDRLGRSAKDVLNIAHEFEQEGAFIRTLDGVDTSNRLIGPLILGMLALVAQFERSMIAARTKAGMAERKAQGAVFGPSVLIVVTQAAEPLQIAREHLRHKHGRARLPFGSAARHLEHRLHLDQPLLVLCTKQDRTHLPRAMMSKLLIAPQQNVANTHRISSTSSSNSGLASAMIGPSAPTGANTR